MSRILCIDYGMKRTGIAVTDPLRIIATALETVDTAQLFNWLKKYLAAEPVGLFLIGYPLNLDDSPTHATAAVDKTVRRLQKEFPAIPVEKADERFTSKMASRAMVEMGMKKSQRRQKGNVDQVAATMMLQDYLRRNEA